MPHSVPGDSAEVCPHSLLASPHNLIMRMHPPYLETKRLASVPTDILITRRHAPPYLEMRRQTRGPTDIFITRHPCTPPPGDEAPDQRPY